MPSGYIYTDVLIGLARCDLPAAEMAAAVRLLELRKAGNVSLFTSSVAKEELARHAAAGAVRVEDVVYLLLDEIPAATEEYILPPILGATTFGSYGPIVTDEVLGRIRAIVPGEDDARHIFQAAHQGLDYFITCDGRPSSRTRLRSKPP